MKIDIKNIIILILIVFSCFSAWNWLIKGDKESKSKVEELDKQFNDLKMVKDSLDKSNQNLKLKFSELKRLDDELSKKNIELQEEVKKSESVANKSQKELTRLMKEKIEIKKKIEELEKNPIKREGDDLLESLKNKTK